MTLTLNRTSVMLAFGIALLSPALAPAQINQGQVDMFETGTTLNWGIGGTFAGPTVQPGGPAGASDHYLQLISGQSGGPPRWVVFNDVQWTGNYNTPAPPGSNPVNAIEMDIANFSATFVATRIVLKTGNGNTPGYAFSGGTGTNGANNIPADGGIWHHVVFPINSSTMTPINSPPPLTTLLGSVGELRILHSMSPSTLGDPFVGRVGIDNIHAFFLPVPEPTGILAAAFVVAVIPAVRRRWRPGRASA